MSRLMELLNKNAKKRFGIGSDLAAGERADLTMFDLDTEYEIKTENFLSMGKATPFEGEKVFGKCLLTMNSGRIVWQENLTEK